MKKIFLFLSSAFFALSLSAQDARSILEKAVAVTGNNRTCEYTMKGTEREPNKTSFIKMEMITKVNASPLKIYSKVLSDPNKGTELLYVKGERGDKVKVNPGKFLPTLNLTYNSSLLTKDQHHVLLSSGFSFFARLIRDGIKQADAQNRFDDVFKYEGDVVFGGRKCFKIVITDPTYKYETVTAKSGDNLFTFCQRQLVPEIKLIELNSWIKNFETDLSGKTIKVPSSYAKSSVVYIDQSTYFPIYQEMSDDRGLYEKYEYNNLKVNPNFSADEFSEKFSEYNF